MTTLLIVLGILVLLAAGGGTGGYLWYRYEQTPKRLTEKGQKEWEDFHDWVFRHLKGGYKGELPEYLNRFREEVKTVMERCPPWQPAEKKIPKLPKGGES